MNNTSPHDPVAIQDDIISSFRMFPEWLDRYQYLIDLGRKLPPLSVEEKTDDKLLRVVSRKSGCTWKGTQTKS